MPLVLEFVRWATPSPAASGPCSRACLDSPVGKRSIPPDLEPGIPRSNRGGAMAWTAEETRADDNSAATERRSAMIQQRGRGVAWHRSGLMIRQRTLLIPRGRAKGRFPGRNLAAALA